MLVLLAIFYYAGVSADYFSSVSVIHVIVSINQTDAVIFNCNTYFQLFHLQFPPLLLSITPLKLFGGTMLLLLIVLPLLTAPMPLL